MVRRLMPGRLGRFAPVRWLMRRRWWRVHRPGPSTAHIPLHVCTFWGFSFQQTETDIKIIAYIHTYCVKYGMFVS